MYCFQLWPEANVPKRVRTIQAYLLFFQIPTSFSQDISWLCWVFFSLFSTDLSSESYPKTTLKKGLHRSFSLCIKTLLLLLNLKLAPISCTGWYSIKGWKMQILLQSWIWWTLATTPFYSPLFQAAESTLLSCFPLLGSIPFLWSPLSPASEPLPFLLCSFWNDNCRHYSRNKFIQLHSYVCSLLFP